MRQLVAGSLILGLLSVVIGAVLVAVNAPESCQGWPICHGATTRSGDASAVLHMAHRISGVFMIVLLGGATAYAYARTDQRGWLVRLLTVSFALGLVHAVLGGVGTTIAFPNGMSAVHLTLALLLCSMLLGTLIWLTPHRLQVAGTVQFDGILHGTVGGAVALLMILNTATTLEAGVIPAIGAAGGARAAILLLFISSTVATLWLSLRTAGSGAIVARLNLGLLLSAGALGLAASNLDTLNGVASAVVPISFFSIVLTSVAVGLDTVRGPLIRLLEGELPLTETRFVRAKARDLLRVTKPAIMILLLTTTLTSMLVAARGWPGFDLVLWTLLGGALASGGASAMNCYLDRDIDGVMARTRKRPIPTGTLSGDEVRGFALLLSFGSVFVLATFVNPLAAGLALAGNLFYVGIYTQWLKRSTPQNIVIGGAAGSFPPLVGWAAVTGSLGIVPLLLAAIVFYWTPPHFWSLALLKANDYRRAGIPMLPVSHGDAYTRRAILLYTLLLIPVTLLVVPAGGAGMTYLVVAACLGVMFFAFAWRMYREDSSRLAWRLFKFSNYYLALLLFALVIDRMIA